MYASIENKLRNKRDDFYNQINEVIEILWPNQAIIILGVDKARIGNEAVPRIKL